MEKKWKMNDFFEHPLCPECSTPETEWLAYGFFEPGGDEQEIMCGKCLLRYMAIQADSGRFTTWSKTIRFFS